jgi:RimJ/RimL family protein N-acetyltransferase
LLALERGRIARTGIINDDMQRAKKLDQRDAEAWAVLRREVLEVHPLAFGASVPEDPQTLVASARTRLAASDESEVFGAFKDNSLAGIVGVFRDKEKKQRHKALIWGMYVCAANRRGGVGETLLRRAIRESLSWQGVEQIHLAVSEVATEARRLYEKLGFQEWGREPRALCWLGRYADEAQMVLDLRRFGERP